MEKNLKTVCEYEKLVSEARDALKIAVNDELRLSAYLELLNKVLHKKETDLNTVHLRKINNMYRDNIFVKQERNCVINLQDTVISDDIMQVLRLGMCCHIKNRYNPIINQIEVEKL